jgi:virulence-associated protein VagC
MAKRKAKAKKPGRVSEATPANPNVVDTVVFRSGNSDAIRVPKRFGLLGKTVRVRKVSDSTIVVDLQTKRSWPPGFFERFGAFEGFKLPPREPPSARDEERLAYVIEAFSKKD